MGEMNKQDTGISVNSEFTSLIAAIKYTAFTYSTIKETVNSSDYTALHDRMINE
jgi:hypothetical protein